MRAKVSESVCGRGDMFIALRNRCSALSMLLVVSEMLQETEARALSVAGSARRKCGRSGHETEMGVRPLPLPLPVP